MQQQKARTVDELLSGKRKPAGVPHQFKCLWKGAEFKRRRLCLCG